MDSESGDSCTLRAQRFADSMARAMRFATFPDDKLPTHILGGVVALASGGSEQLSVLERALGEAAMASIAAGEGDSDEEMRTVVLRDMHQFVQRRIVDAMSAAAIAAQSFCFERKFEHVALFAGSHVAERAVSGMAGSVMSVSVVDAWPNTPGKTVAQRLANEGVAVRYGLLAAAEDLINGVGALFLGAEEVGMNGRVLVAAGAAPVAALCKEKGVLVVVVAQSAKFSDGMLVDLNVGGRDVLIASEVDIIVTENGNVLPVMAPRMLKKGSLNYVAGAAGSVRIS